MRRLAALAVLLVALGAMAGCQLLLGIDDPIGDECSPFDLESCDPDDTCDLDPDFGRLSCRMEGTVPAGELCFEYDDCAGPLSCVDGVCRTFCPVFGQPCDAPEAECLKHWGSSQVCDSACSVVDDTGCIPDTECILTSNDNGAPIAMCVPHGYFGAVTPGEPCAYQEECVPGYTCDDPEGDGGLCGQLCRVGDTCPDSSTCVARFETLHTEQLGICPP